MSTLTSRPVVSLKSPHYLYPPSLFSLCGGLLYIFHPLISTVRKKTLDGDPRRLTAVYDSSPSIVVPVACRGEIPSSILAETNYSLCVIRIGGRVTVIPCRASARSTTVSVAHRQAQLIVFRLRR